MQLLFPAAETVIVTNVSIAPMFVNSKHQIWSESRNRDNKITLLPVLSNTEVYPE